MTTGERIKNARKAASLTQRKLAEKCGLSTGTIQQYELDKRSPKNREIVEKLATALNVSGVYLMWGDEPSKPVPHNNFFWTSYLDDKLKQLGCWLSHDEDNAMTWIEFQDGALEVTEADLKELDDSTVSYLQFKLEELKKKRPNDFRPRRRKPDED